jgi:IclR family pca regulon transcriptional regulator
VRESTALAVLVPSGPDSTPEIQYTARAVSPRIMGVDIRVGTRLPAPATSLGRVLLADTESSADLDVDLDVDLDRVRAQGYALLDEDWEDGLRTLAVPLRDRTGRVVAAVNVALHAAGRTAQECVAEILPELRLTATRIETELHAAGRFTRVPLL